MIRGPEGCPSFDSVTRNMTGTAQGAVPVPEMNKRMDM